MTVKPLIPALLACVVLQSAQAAGPIDPALAGTWKLQWERADYFWAVRDDGVYRLHGPGGPAQHGRLEATGGRWSLKSVFWADAGTYTLSDADTWTVTGRLGPGTWKRAWSPASGQSEEPADQGTCGLLNVAEVARVLRAPVTASLDPHEPGRCIYESQLGEFDKVTITVINSRREHWFLTRKHPNPQLIPVPGIAEDAYAEGGLGGASLSLHILKGGSQARIELGLKPASDMQDLPYLIELGRAAGPRIGTTGPDLQDLLDLLPGN